MDALHLNKINELAREYLRLGIARNTQDAVEKARFQLSFETKKQPEEASPYASFFPEEKRESPARSREAPEISVFDTDRLRSEETLRALSRTIQEHQRFTTTQQERISRLEGEIGALRSEISSLKRLVESPPQIIPAITPAQAQNIPTVDEHQAFVQQPMTQPITRSIEQTIKGRAVSSDDVAVEKIFYFGNR